MSDVLKIHLSAPVLDLLSYLGRGVDDTRWTVCGLRTDPDYPKLVIVTHRSLVTCGNCTRSRRQLDLPQEWADLAPGVAP